MEGVKWEGVGGSEEVEGVEGVGRSGERFLKFPCVQKQEIHCQHSSSQSSQRAKFRQHQSRTDSVNR